MREQISVALVQFAPHEFTAKEKNVSYMVDQIIALGKQGIDLIVFPELSVSGFFRHEPGGKLAYWEKGAEDLDGESSHRIITAAKEVGVYVVFGLAERLARPVEMYNTAVLVGPGGIVGAARKMHLPLYEKFYFTSGRLGTVLHTPLGQIGLAICYDMYFPEAIRILAVNGAEIIIAISSMWKGGDKGGVGLIGSKERIFDITPVCRAMENQVYFLSCNGCGRHDMGPMLGVWERLGNSKVVDPLGNILAVADCNRESVITAVLTREVLIKGRSAFGFLADRIPELYSDLIYSQVSK
ncbi:carbon-nitrogen hydrolase family protein [Calderihabitans maritimus]|nr:carbon-nitrogen hydrolase family protein [Calderihabitans maritimus]